MRRVKALVAAGAVGAVAAYFAIMLLVVPPAYLDTYSLHPRPAHTVTLSNETIMLGESFLFEVYTINDNDFADLLITTIGFPQLEDASLYAQLIGYSFEQSPRYVVTGEPVSAAYGATPDGAPHAAIESMTADVVIGGRYSITLEITPTEPGPFVLQVKSVSVPHADELAHYPHSGAMDAYGELVEIYEINVLP